MGVLQFGKNLATLLSMGVEENHRIKRLLILDDDLELCELLKQFLVGDGFEVATVSHPRDLPVTGLEESFDLLIIDVMLPGENGFEILKRLRNTSAIPIIMLTARGEELDRILGLELGADDYLPKPFNPRELSARIRAIFRRLEAHHSPTEGDTLRVGQIRLHAGSRKAFVADREIRVTDVEFRLLEIFVRAAGKVQKRQDLALKVLDRRLAYDDRSLDVHISNLRRKINGPDGPEIEIKTIRGIGYMLTLPDSTVPTDKGD